MSDWSDEAYSEAMDEIAKKDAEIERLKGEWKESISKNAALTIRNVELKSLITDLSDAWIRRDYPYTEQGVETPLLQKAREAVM
jgi:regulator of replication initiation timing